jgi:acyl transferase domain-containing protein/NADPH:quinone reductase-like Zn-dependent oxidoreductase
MGRELYQLYPPYASSLDRASSHLSRIGASFSLIEELSKDETSTQVNVAHVSQPACTAIQLALVELLRSWNVTPSAVVGHSSGEIAAAYSAGIITFDDAMTIAYHRGRLVPILKERYPALNGCMMAVGAGTKDILPLLERVPSSLGEVRIACINSPLSVTVSGDADAITELHRLIEEVNPGMFARKLAVDTAYHSHHMNLVAKDYTESLQKLQPPRPSEVSFHSSLLGRTATYLELDATYWVQNLTCAVRFDEAVQSMCAPVREAKTGINFLVELGPHAALQGPLKQILKEVGGVATKIPYTSALSRKKDAVHTALALAGTLFVKGAMLDMGAINFPKTLERQPQVLTDMPRYAWNHSTTYHHESRLTKIHKFHDAPRNDLLGVLAPYSDDIEPIWRNILRLDDVPWLRHHQMQGVNIFPISGFAVMAIEAMAQQAHTIGMTYDVLEINDLSVKTPAMLTEEDLEMTTTLRPHLRLGGKATFEFHVRSWSQSKGWTENCTGVVSACLTEVNEVDGQRVVDERQCRLDHRIAATKRLSLQQTATEAMYKKLDEIGVSYGTTLQGLQDCHASSSASSAQISASDTASEMPEHQESLYVLHPVTLEKLITMYWPILDASGPLDTVHLPSSIGKIALGTKTLEFLREPAKCMRAFCEQTTGMSSPMSNKLSLVATTDAGELLISIEDLLISPIVEIDVGLESETARELCFKLDWEPAFLDAGRDSIITKQLRFDADIVIIHGNSKAQLDTASMLSDKLLALTGAVPTLGSLLSLAGASQDKLCIVIAELETPLLSTLDATDFEALQHLLTTVRGALWVVRGAYINSNNPDTNMISGLSRTLRSEGTLMKFITLDLEAREAPDSICDSTTILRVFTESLKTGANLEETEFLERHGQLLTPRITNDDSLNEYVNQQIHPTATEPASFSDVQRPLYGYFERPNVLDSLTFTDHKPSKLAEDDVEIQVKAIGLSSTDLEANHAIGMECSGIVTAVGSDVPSLRVGDRVAGFAPNGSLSTVTRAKHPFLFKLSDHTTFESAASIPLSYCTASYALIKRAGLCEEDSILIHDAASVTGQAALSIAQMVGADIWATVKSAVEKTHLMSAFGVHEGRILYARSEEFAESIRYATKGRGVDVVFDTFGNTHLASATQSTLADFGRHVVMDTHRHRDFNVTKANTSTISVDIQALRTLRPQVVQRTLADVGRMLKHNTIQPLNDVKTYGISEVAAAIHALQAGGPHGKVVIKPQDDEMVMVSNISFYSVVVLTSKGTAHSQAGYTASRRRDLHSYRWHGWLRKKHGKVDGVQRSQEHCPSLAKWRVTWKGESTD